LAKRGTAAALIGVGGAGLAWAALSKNISKESDDWPERPVNPTVSVIVPALNEAGSIDWVLENLPPGIDELVLVDGLSTDYTEAIVQRLHPGAVVVHQHNKGKGSALRAGFAAASKDIIVMIDADGSTDPREIPRFIDALKAGADFAKGSRHMHGGGSVDFTPLRRIGNMGFVALSNVLYGHQFTDLLYGYAAFWRSDLPALKLTAVGFEVETQLILNAAKAGMRITEVPSIELERRAGASHLHTWSDGLRCLRTMIREHPLLGNPSDAAADMSLIQVLKPGSTSPSWRPAGADRRSGFDRRKAETVEVLAEFGERRSGVERRQEVDLPVTVFIVRALEDRRKLSRQESGYTGPERRSGTDRRQQPDPLRRNGKANRRTG
jgi:glycosyltransferase involved in cell wall biosynthesis